MASLKAEKPVGTQSSVPAKKEQPAKGPNTTTKAAASKPTSKTAEVKPQSTKKKVRMYMHIHASRGRAEYGCCKLQPKHVPFNSSR